MQSSLSGTTPCLEFSIFLTVGFVICSYGLPIVLARADVVSLDIALNARLNNGNEHGITQFFFFRLN